VNPTLDRYLSARQLDQLPAPDAEVLSFWEKSLGAYADARNASSSLDNRLLRAYDAARLAALAIVRAAGFRPKGARGTTTSPSTWPAVSPRAGTWPTRFSRRMHFAHCGTRWNTSRSKAPIRRTSPHMVKP
jgi:hypothetical protein